MSEILALGGGKERIAEIDALHKREQLVASRAPNGRIVDGACYVSTI